MYLIPELFSFIKENKMFKLIKGNSFLNKYLNLSSKMFLQKKLKVIIFITLMIIIKTLKMISIQ
jgi:hypothetical protein